MLSSIESFNLKYVHFYHIRPLRIMFKSTGKLVLVLCIIICITLDSIDSTFVKLQFEVRTLLPYSTTSDYVQEHWEACTSIMYYNMHYTRFYR